MVIQKVLVADGSSKDRKNTIRSLKNIGVSGVKEATDGEQAIDLFKQSSFDAVFADLDLPAGRGLEVVREIRKSNQDVPIILTTTAAESDLAQEAMRAGASDILLKPFTADTLREKLEPQLSA